MIIFWSWQSDIPKEIGRFFVRDALREAIEALKTDQELVEPIEREAAARLQVDSDRQGVPGSPDLAATIFEKIEKADVFVADVTLVGATPDGKKLINSNVAIEYGHAHRALGARRVLMVQNLHYGDGDALPFDLRQKSWPLHYTIAPGASKAEIKTERDKLKAQFVVALRPYLTMTAAAPPEHVPTPATFTKAVFFQPNEILAQNHAPPPDAIDYHFSQRSALYLRLMPVRTRATPIKLTRLYDDVLNRRVDLLLRNLYMGVGDRNTYGAITYEPHGAATEPRAFTQVFPNGEFWAVTTEMFVRHQSDDLIPTTNVRNIFGRVLENFVGLSNGYGNGTPLRAIIGGVGLRGKRLGIGPHSMSQPIHVDERQIEIDLVAGSQDERDAAIATWLAELYDIAGVRHDDEG
ncbi:hypothetical protein [Bradyrhizobium sp. SYSU BS000235]|uniref:hypothetical protein n=1 Tax=Bradyrhizobium sp. SYSU BS000235 TaxID=3411332 RepID=UPI003C7474E4